MNQLVMFHFVINLNEKHFQFLAQPGTNFDEIESALEEFKVKFAELKAAAIENEKAKAAEAQQAEEVSLVEAPVVEAEVVSE